MPRGGLRERAWIRDELRPDECHQRPEREVLGEREPECEASLVEGRAPSDLVEREAEHGAVQSVERETAPPVAATEQVDVRVRAAEQPLVERLQQSPDRRGERTGRRRARTRWVSVHEYIEAMPEGDALHRAARRLQVLVGQELQVETPHPRAAVKGLAPLLDGRRLEAVEAVGKNLLLRFQGDVVVRSHLRMKGRWRVLPRDADVFGTPWLLLRGDHHVAVMSGGSVLELDRGVAQRLGPDILAGALDVDAIVRNLRAVDQARPVGDAVLDQRLVAGIGNMWKAECLWAAEVSPWRSLADCSDGELRAAVEHAHLLMKRRLDGARDARRVYRRVGRPCPRCRTPIRSWPRGDGARMAYWCPQCQPGPEPRGVTARRPVERTSHT